MHNRCDPGPNATAIEDALRRSTLDGVTVADVQDAWSRYGTDAPDVWLRKYINLRQIVGGGSQYEIEVLGRVGVDKNNAAFPPDEPTFIPDGVRSTDPPGFVEVKRYDNTVLQPSSNAGKQLEYRIDWAESYPAGPPPSLELWISDMDNISPSFSTLLTRAAQSRVLVSVNGQRVVP